MSDRVIDVSHWQGYIDWGLVRDSGIAGAFIKATGEETAGPVPYKDGRFLGNWNAAGDAKVKRGAYHFMDGSRGSGSGRAEGDFFCNTVEATGSWGELFPVIDVEWPLKAQEFDIDQLRELIEVVHDRCGYLPTIYTGRFYWQQIPDIEALFEAVRGCHLWIASYTKTCPPPPKPWDRIDLWQYTDKGQVAGIKGNVDMSQVLTSLTDLTFPMKALGEAIGQIKGWFRNG